MRWIVDGVAKANASFAYALASTAIALWVQSAVAADSPYMAECRAKGVPIPPDWAETGTPWVKQGELQTKLTLPSKAAYVWTYSDPTVRGACVALPRGTGVSGDVAGIICQSATTGAACFWDNMPKNNQSPGVLGWSGQTLQIANLADGSNLTGVTGVCTYCHRGDNVFLISPDDPTWAKVLRGPLVTSPGSTFTTRVEASSDNQGGHPRYVPVTQPGWTNAFAAGVCAGSCHEQPAVSSPPMPPACAAGGVTNCYGKPATDNLVWLPPVVDLLLN